MLGRAKSSHKLVDDFYFKKMFHIRLLCALFVLVFELSKSATATLGESALNHGVLRRNDDSKSVSDNLMLDDESSAALKIQMSDGATGYTDGVDRGLMEETFEELFEDGRRLASFICNLELRWTRKSYWQEGKQDTNKLSNTFYKYSFIELPSSNNRAKGTLLVSKCIPEKRVDHFGLLSLTVGGGRPIGV
jgi:hypothetical protein